MAWESLDLTVLDYLGALIFGLLLIAPIIAALVGLGRLDENLFGVHAAESRRTTPHSGSAIRTALQGLIDHRRD
ncbi:MAG: hypothetical protein O7A65_09770 [Proteobacteria bacterium]|nr:hypothetical protein [Pseudomonadota bacterium]